MLTRERASGYFRKIVLKNYHHPSPPPYFPHQVESYHAGVCWGGKGKDVQK